MKRCERCQTDNAANASQCSACGCFLRGNQSAVSHGLYRYRDRGTLPPNLKVSVDEFREQLILDQGGLDGLSAVRAGLLRLLVDAEVGRRLMMNMVIARGAESKSGRAAYDRLLATIDRWLRIAEKLGVERKPREVETIQSWAASVRDVTPTRTQDAPASSSDDAPESDVGGVTGADEGES